MEIGMKIQDLETKNELSRRLKRIAGQVRGVERMVEEERECREIAQQLAAIRSAVHQTSVELMRSYAACCLTEEDEQARDLMVEDLMAILSRSA